MRQRIYLDNSATTQLDSRVFKAMIQELERPTGNPSSLHGFGREAKKRLTSERDCIAHFLKIKSSELIFTSGGTEALNLLIHGLYSGGEILSSDVEHAAVYKTLLNFSDVTLLPARLHGAITPEQLEAAITERTRLIVLTAVNSETGVKSDVEALAAIAEMHKIPLIIDAVAWLGKERFVIPRGVTGMAFSAHKIHGPKGAGAAFIRSGAQLSPCITGGEQEKGRRAGTENITGIVGFAEAIRQLDLLLPEATERMEQLMQLFIQGVLAKTEAVINGEGPKICSTINLSFPGHLGEDLLIQLDLLGVATSHGSACSSGALEPSRVLLNMGYEAIRTKSALRFSISRETTEQEILEAVAIISDLVSPSSL